MINESIVKNLKQTNISANPVKTKTRVQELWKTATKSQKSTVEEMAGISRATIYRVYNTGSISAKLATPMAQSFNVNPDYLTAKTDEKGECTDDILIKFLTDLGYEDLLKAEMKKAKRRNLRKKDQAKPVQTDAHTTKPVTKTRTANVSAKLAPSVAKLTDEETQLLLQALLLKEKAGVADAAAKAVAIRALLLSN